MLIVGDIELHIIEVETQFRAFIDGVPAAKVYAPSSKVYIGCSAGINGRIDPTVRAHPNDVAMVVSLPAKKVAVKYQA